MAQVKDPVCGMTIDSATAAATSTHNGGMVYFCSPGCKKQFDADPSRFAPDKASGAGHGQHGQR